MRLGAGEREREVVKETEKTLKGNRFAILATEREVHQDFPLGRESRKSTKTDTREINSTREEQ